MSGDRGPVDYKEAKVLIVEDDRTLEPLWHFIVESVLPGVGIDWVTSGELAMLLDSHEYGLIISDIFLGGAKTGLDVWQKFSKNEGAIFILMSVLSTKRLEILADGLDLPAYLQKPTDPNQAIASVRALILANSRSEFRTRV